MLEKNWAVKMVETNSQPFYASSNCIEAQLYQDNVGPISIKESIKDSPKEDLENLAFDLFGLTKEDNV